MYRKNESKLAKIALHDIGFSVRGEKRMQTGAYGCIIMSPEIEAKVPTEPEKDRKNDRQRRRVARRGYEWESRWEKQESAVQQQADASIRPPMPFPIQKSDEPMKRAQGQKILFRLGEILKTSARNPRKTYEKMEMIYKHESPILSGRMGGEAHHEFLSCIESRWNVISRNSVLLCAHRF